MSLADWLGRLFSGPPRVEGLSGEDDAILTEEYGADNPDVPLTRPGNLPSGPNRLGLAAAAAEAAGANGPPSGPAR
jgi:hypothetical protein